MDRAALLVIDAQQEYFAPIGKVVLPAGPAAVARIARMLESLLRERGIERVIVSGS
jgi:nicotinamidase-related amidase